MFSFSFASKMLNTIMGTEEGQPGQPGQGGPMGPGGQQQSMGGIGQGGPSGMRPTGPGGFPQVRPTPGQGGPGGSPRPGFPGPPTFSGPRPSPGVRAGPPSFGGPPRPTMGGVGTPHRFNGPQPPPQTQQQQQMQQQQQLQPMQQHQPMQQQQPPPGQMNRSMSPMQQGGRAPSPRGPMPLSGPNQPFPQRSPAGVPGGAAPSSSSSSSTAAAAAPVPEVDLSHLSAEERAMIENVMAKAQQLEQGPPTATPGLPASSQSGQPGGPQRMLLRPEAQQPGMGDMGGVGVRMCPICRQRDVSGKMDGIPGQECTECRLLVCNRCGGMVPPLHPPGVLSPHPDTKRPEWLCGNCINKRRQRVGQYPPQGNISSAAAQGLQQGGQQQLQQTQQRPMGPYGSQLQQPITNQSVDVDGVRRGSGGLGMQGSPQQQSEREFDKIESKEEMMMGVGGWGTETKHRRRPSFEEIFSPERSEQIEDELLHESPPLDLDFNYQSDPSYPDHSQCMSIPHTASASQAKPSFVTNTKLHSRSLSIDMAEKQDNVLSPPHNGFEYYPGEQSSSATTAMDEELSYRRQSQDSLKYSSSHMFEMESPPSGVGPPMQIPQFQSPPQQPPMDEKTSALMEELSKLQSAVDSTLKRQRQKQETDERDERQFFNPIRSRSPSPSPSPRSPTTSMSPMQSPSTSHHHFHEGQRMEQKQQQPENLSPESPDVPGPRKAIVLKDHDLDDYKSSSEEEAESDDSDETARRKGTTSSSAAGGGEVYYDHSPGEVYTIPEEEDEGGSPTGGDLVTSLKRQGMGGMQGGNPGDLGGPRRRMPAPSGPQGQDMLGPMDPRQPLRPQLRPQRSLDNRLPSTQAHMDLSTNQSMDQQANIYATNNNVNTQSVTHSALGTLDNQGMHQDMSTSSIGVHSSSQPNAMMNVTTTSSSGTQQQQGQQLSDHYQQQNQQQHPIFGTVKQVGSEHQQHSMQDPMQHGLLQSHQPQMGQLPPGAGGVDQLQSGVNVNEWNNVSGQQTSMLGPTSAGVATDLMTSTGVTQSYQLQQPNSYSQIPTSSVQPPNGQQQGFQQNSQAFPQSLQQPTPLHPQQQQQIHGTHFDNTQLQSQQQPQNLTQNFQTTSLQTQPLNVGNQPPPLSTSPLQGNQLQQLQAQQAQAQQLAQQQSWQNQQDSQLSVHSLYDQSGRPVSSAISPMTQTQSHGQQKGSTIQPQDPYQQQQMQMMQQQYQQSGNQGMQQHQLSSVAGGMNVQGSAVHTSQAGGPGAKGGSISGLLADFSRALGLGSTSPRPSPSEDKSLAFSVTGGHSQGQPLSPYDQYQPQQQHPTSLPQSISHQHSAFASIHDSYQRQNQQLSYLTQSQQPGQSIPAFGPGGQLQQSQQHFGSSPLASQPSFQQVMAQQQAGGVGVIGALSPAQAHMYQQQMAIQHQQQHMKKRSRGGQMTTGDIRRDGQQSTVLIGGQGLAVTPSGMTIGALTPAVVTSLGTFIGGGPTILGTQLIQQPMSGTLGASQGFGGWTPVGTPRSGREPPGAGDSSDTMSETDSQKSLRMRRKLPCLPPEEAAPLPSAKKRDRHRSQEHLRSISPLRMQTSDGMLSGRQYPFSSLSLSRPSASESNLRKIAMSDPVPRPGSALGLLQASSVVSSMGVKPEVYPLSSSLFSTSTNFPGMQTNMGYGTDLTTTTSVLAGLYPSHKTANDNWNANLAELAACLPPDLRHLLNKGTGSLDHELSGVGLSGIVSGLGESSLNSGSQLPSYIRTLREQLQEERRQLLSEERRRLEQLRERDRELGARLDAVTSRAGSDGLRSRADLSRNVGISRSAGASPLLSRKLKSHRRQLSDPKLSLPFSPIQEDGDNELQDFDRVSADLLRHKSYEYESLEDSALLHHRSSSSTTTHQPQFDWDHSQSYLASSWAAAGGVLRETAINSMGSARPEDHLSSSIPSRYLSRRNSDGETSMSTSRLSASSRDRRHQMRKHRKSRSWHPSPYVSEEEEEEEEDLLSREEKKARIKAEIARRRQQLQERGGGLHHTDLGRLRDGSSDHERHSVLKSVDQLIRDQYGRYDSPQSYGSGVTSGTGRYLMYSSSGGIGGEIGVGAMSAGDFSRFHHHSGGMGGIVRGPGGNIISPTASEEDRSIERIASTFRSSDEMRIASAFRHHNDELYYERLGEMSPMATDSESMGSEVAAMPILPDMPTRSRRLLEDLGSAPIGLNEGGGLGGSASSAQNMKAVVGIHQQSRKFQPQPTQPSTVTLRSRSFIVVTDNRGMCELPQVPQQPSFSSRQGHFHHMLDKPPRRRPTGDNCDHQLDSREQRAFRRIEYHSHAGEFSQPMGAVARDGCPPEDIPMNIKADTSRSGSRTEEQVSKKTKRTIISPPHSRHQQVDKGSDIHPAAIVPSPVNTPPPDVQKYQFSTIRYLLTRDLTDQSIESNGIGVKIVGGKELPGSGGQLAAYVAKIFPGKLGDSIPDIREGDVVLEWNGISLDNKTFEEVASTLHTPFGDEIELIIRRDYDIATGQSRTSAEDKVDKGPTRHDPSSTSTATTINVDLRQRQNLCISSYQEKHVKDDDVLLGLGRKTCSDFISESETDCANATTAYDHDYNIYGQRESIVGHEINSSYATPVLSLSSMNRLVKSPSSSTEATNTSAGTSSIHHSSGGNLFDSGGGNVGKYLVLPSSEVDVRKRSTSLPPSLTDAQQQQQQQQQQLSQQYQHNHHHEHRNRNSRKGSENISVKSMGIISPPSSDPELFDMRQSQEDDVNLYHKRGPRRMLPFQPAPTLTTDGKKGIGCGVGSGSFGQIQLQICHDSQANILYVTVLKARLPKQHNEDGTDHVQVDPYVTVNLYPDPDLQNQRRTRRMPMSSSPQWNQTMVYPNVTIGDLKDKYLEVAARNFNPTGDEDPLFGKVILYLSDDGILDEKPHSYSLRLVEKASGRRKSSQSHLRSQTKSSTSKWDSSSGEVIPTTARRHSSRCSLTEQAGKTNSAERDQSILDVGDS